MTRFLITGGAGFVGSALADKLSSDSSNEVVVVDDLSTGFAKYVTSNPKIEFIKVDINNYHNIAGVFSSNHFDYIYHYAAVVGVQRTLENPIKVLNDIEGFKNILNLAKDTGVKRVLYASSSEVYGEPVETPQHEETTPLNSRLPYAIVKNVGESFFRSYQEEFGLDYTIFRFFNTYGPRQSAVFVMTKFINTAIKSEDITIYGDGKQTRTFCYIDDNIEATINALNEESAINQEINIGSDVEITITNLAKIIIKLTDSKSKIVHLPALERGDMTRRQPDITKMRKLLNRDLIPLEKGIKKLLQKIL